MTQASIDQGLLAWPAMLFKGVKYTSIVKTRATGGGMATTGDRNEIWAGFEGRPKGFAHDSLPMGEGDDLFVQASVAAE